MENMYINHDFETNLAQVALGHPVNSSLSLEQDADLMTMMSKVLQKKGILPMRGHKPISGADLIRRIRPLLGSKFTDNTLRSYLSQLAKVETSPIAKTVGRHGYFFRDNSDDQDLSNDLSTATEVGKRDQQEEEKFRALIIAHLDQSGLFPAHIEHTKSKRDSRGANIWMHCDVVFATWNEGTTFYANGKRLIDPRFFEIYRAMGERAFDLDSVELKIDISMSNYRSFMSQCASNSSWANGANLYFAKSVNDERLAENVTDFARECNMSVLSYNLTDRMLEKLPSASEIRRLKAADLDSLVLEYCSNVTVFNRGIRNRVINLRSLNKLSLNP